MRIAYSRRGESGTNEDLFTAVFDARGAKIDQSLNEGDNRIAGLKTSELGYGLANHSAVNLWLIGPASKINGFETTAIAEIRQQTQRAAQEILSAIKIPSNPIIDRMKSHPKHDGETYREHFYVAINTVGILLKVSMALMIHAVCPIFFVDLASTQLRIMSRSLTQKRVGSRSPKIKRFSFRGFLTTDAKMS